MTEAYGRVVLLNGGVDSAYLVCAPSRHRSAVRFGADPSMMWVLRGTDTRSSSGNVAYHSYSRHALLDSSHTAGFVWQHESRLMPSRRVPVGELR
ncbi:MAG: hypothetical protein ACI9QQ_001310 [Myxococcota bacterium]|jgi:hypothetical protein